MHTLADTLQACESCCTGLVVMLQRLPSQLHNGGQDAVMSLQGAFLQRLSVKCIHKPAQHCLLAEVGMCAKAMAKAEARRLSSP